MTSTELIKDMLERQKAYDAEVFKKHNVDYVSKSQLESALFDELGELMHAQKSDWCWWKKTQAPVDDKKVLGELVDIWHFVLSWQNNFNGGKEGLLTCEQTMKKVDENRWSIEGCRNGIVIKLADLASFSLWKVEPLIAISEYLGFTIEQVYEAYCDKNKINYQRLESGY